jgi:hypothetical protein
MLKNEWYELYRDVRTPVIGENLFPRLERAEIALMIVLSERKEERKAHYDAIRKARY